MAEISSAFKVKKGLDVTGDSSHHGNMFVDGYITTPTLTATENSTKVATTEFVRTAIANLVANSPATLDTLNELAQALGDDPNFATTITNNLALKAPLASPALTGIPTAPTPVVTDNGTTIATTAFIKNQGYATLSSPALTGIPTAPTPALGDNSTTIPTTAFIQETMAATGFGYDAGAIPGGVTSSIDIKTIPSGLYVVTANNTGTKADGLNTGFLLVSREGNGTNVHQVYFDDSSARSFHRSYSGSAWSAWREVSYLDSPAFTGTPTAPTATVDTNNTQIATTAFMLGQAGTANPTMAGTAAPGTSTRFARQDHVHPTDTTRAPVNNAALTGIPTAPTASPNNNSTQIATTAYADAIASLKANIASPAFTGGVSVSGGLYSSDHALYPFVNGGTYNASGSVTGALKIKLPVAYVDTFVCFDVDVFEDANNAAFKMRIYGYAASSGTWVVSSAVLMGQAASRLPNVRFGNDGTTTCVWLGELTDTWSYPTIAITNVHLGYGGDTSAWNGPWTLSYITAYDTIKLGPIAPTKFADLNSPAFTGVPTVPTPATSDNSSTIPNTSWVNAAIAASGSTSIVTIPVTSTAMTLSAAQYANSMIVFTGTLTGNTVITVPNTAHAFIAANNTSGAYSLTIISQGKSPSVNVVQNKANSLYCDTTGVYATSSTTGVQFAKQIPLSANTTLDLSYLGTVVFITTPGITVTLPFANIYPGGAGLAVINISGGNAFIATGNGDTLDVSSTPMTVYANDSYFLASNATSVWHTVWYTNEKNPHYKASVTAPRILAGGVADDNSTSVQGTTGKFSGKLNAVNNANLIFNSTGEFGNIGWTNANFSSTFGGSADGYIFSNSAVVNMSSGFLVDWTTTLIPCSAGVPLTVSGEIATGGLTQGNIYLKLEAFDSTNTSLGTICSTTAINATTKSANYQFVSATATTPANTASVRVSKVADSSPQIAALGVAFRRIKLEYGSAPTIYSQEADIAKLLLKDSPIINSGGITFPDGTTQTTANGTTMPTSKLYSVSAGNVSLGASLITTSGYTAPFVVIYKNNLKLVEGVDWTFAGDNKTINLVVAIGNNDQFEVLTNVVITPSTTFTPSSSYFRPAAGASSIPIVYTVGFVRLYQNGAKLIIGQDFSANDGANINFIGFTATGYDDYEVELLTPMTYSNSVAQSNPVLGGSLIFADGSSQGTATANRNRIINGDMRIQQYTSAAVASGSVYAGADRFKATNSGAGGNFSQSVATATVNGQSKFFLVQTVNTAPTSITSTNYWGGLQQFIEANNSYDLIGKQVTLSFLFYTNVAGTFSASVYDGSGGYSVVTSFSAIAGIQKIILTFPSLPSTLSPNSPSNGFGLGISVGFLNNGNYQTSTLNSWQPGILRSASGATNWGATANNYIGWTDVQLEAGGAATPFERRPFGTELALCQRYYYQISSSSNTDVGSGMINQGTSILVPVVFPVPMRTVPTLSSSNLYGTSATQLVACSSAVLDSASTQSVRLDVTCSGASWTVGQVGIVLIQNSGWIAFSAEL